MDVLDLHVAIAPRREFNRPPPSPCQSHLPPWNFFPRFPSVSINGYYWRDLQSCCVQQVVTRTARLISISEASPVSLERGSRSICQGAVDKLNHLAGLRGKAPCGGKLHAHALYPWLPWTVLQGRRGLMDSSRAPVEFNLCARQNVGVRSIFSSSLF